MIQKWRVRLPIVNGLNCFSFDDIAVFLWLPPNGIVLSREHLGIYGKIIWKRKAWVIILLSKLNIITLKNVSQTFDKYGLWAWRWAHGCILPCVLPCSQDPAGSGIYFMYVRCPPLVPIYDHHDWIFILRSSHDNWGISLTTMKWSWDVLT